MCLCGAFSADSYGAGTAPVLQSHASTAVCTLNILSGRTHTIVGTQENNAPTLWNVVVVVVDRSYIFSFRADSLPIW